LDEPTPKKNETEWQPNPGPQTAAFHCEADELFYGGAAGGGKTDLLLGLAGTQHWRAIVFRRVFPNMRSIIERSREVYNSQNESHSKDSYNESLHIWRLASGRIIEFAAIQYEQDKRNFQGRPHDLYGWDEITEFTESQFRFVNAWNRSTKPGQRCRVVATGNPPTSPEGEWVLRYWRPWLDSQHPNPAKPGELRWFAVIEGRDIEVEDSTPFEHNGELIQPRSRTFIPARLDDNPQLRDTGYKSVLQSLPEPLRSQMLYGDFTATARDDAWQCIPTAWIIAAQNRWLTAERPALTLRAVGVDPSRGGDDETVIAKLYGTWFDELVKHPGKDVPDGSTGARYVTDAMGSENAPVYVDVIGYGASVYDHLKPLGGMAVTPVNVGVASRATDKTGRYGFANLRSETWWKLREALDPESGENIALPPDPQLRTDLRSSHYQIVGGKIKVESKEDVKKRIQRSTDRADAVILAWHGANVEPPYMRARENPFYD
jgi:hypothetical protein